jgi:hypothetical protein
MKRISMVLMAAALAIAALPSAASATGWDLDVQTGTLPLKFTISGGATSFKIISGGGTVACSATAGEGEYKTPTEGTVDFTYTGCKRGSEECHSKGAKKEEVTTTTLVFHNIMIDSTVQVTNGKPGILFTGNNNHFATAECTFGNVEYIGNGVIGELFSPICQLSEWRTMATVVFAASSNGQQTYKQAETTGTVFDLTARTFANTETSSIEGKPVLTFERAMKTTCP